MKKYLLGLFALVLAIGFSAFTTNSISKAKNNHSTNFNYFVIGETPTEWIVQVTDPGGCGADVIDPCDIVSDTQKDGLNRIPKTAVVSVTSRQGDL